MSARILIRAIRIVFFSGVTPQPPGSLLMREETRLSDGKEKEGRGWIEVASLPRTESPKINVTGFGCHRFIGIQHKLAKMNASATRKR